MTRTGAIAVARDYHRAWTAQEFDRAAGFLAPDLEVDVPLNRYAGAAEFARGLSGFGRLVRDVRMLAEFGTEDEAMLLYDLDVDGLGRPLRVAEHFTVRGDRITGIRHVHDTAALRAGGFAGEDG